MNTLQKINILANQGIENLPFGSSMDEVKTALGEPDNIESTEDEEEDVFFLCAWNYTRFDLSLFFDAPKEGKVIGLECNGPETTFNGEKVFELKEEPAFEFLLKSGEETPERVAEEWGEVRISSAELGVDFYFEKGVMRGFYAEPAG
jgi:hypothetical protein